MPQFWEINVPTKNNNQAQGRRIHVFVGLADSPLAARNAVHDQALLLHQAGQALEAARG